MTDEVGPNDPNRGRSSAGGFKMPFSRPIAVRGVDDVYDAAWGGMRKPKPRDEQDHQTRTDLSGGGYTSAQTNNDRGKIMLAFVLIPIGVLGFLGVFGWLTDSTAEDPVALSTSCGADGFRATYRRADFHENASTALFSVSLVTESGVSYIETARVDLRGSESEIVEVVAPDLPGFAIEPDRPASSDVVIEQCRVVEIELFR